MKMWRAGEAEAGKPKAPESDSRKTHIPRGEHISKTRNAVNSGLGIDDNPQGRGEWAPQDPVAIRDPLGLQGNGPPGASIGLGDWAPCVYGCHGEEPQPPQSGYDPGMPVVALPFCEVLVEVMAQPSVKCICGLAGIADNFNGPMLPVAPLPAYAIEGTDCFCHILNQMVTNCEQGSGSPMTWTQAFLAALDCVSLSSAGLAALFALAGGPQAALLTLLVGDTGIDLFVAMAENMLTQDPPNVLPVGVGAACCDWLEPPCCPVGAGPGGGPDFRPAY